MKPIRLILALLLVGACTDERSTIPDTEEEDNVWTVIGSDLPAPVTCLGASDSGLIAATSEGLNAWPTDAVLWRWRDSTWVQMAPPVTGEIYEMTWYRGSLVVGGYFELQDDPSTRGLAQWDGASWLPVGAPLGPAGFYRDPFVGSLMTRDDRLYIGGAFSLDGWANVAVWDGNVLENLSCDLTPHFAVWRDTLLAGGNYVSDVGCWPDGPRLLAWTGSEWIDFAGGVYLVYEDCPPEVFVSDLLVTANGLLVAGSIPRVGDGPREHLALWTGSEWHPVSRDGPVNNLLDLDGNLFAADWNFGDSSRVWRWNVSEWVPVGPGFDAHIWDLVAFDGNLVAAGGFTGRVAAAPLAEVRAR